MGDEYIQIGRIKSSFGLRGELKIDFEIIPDKGFDSIEAFFLYINDQYLPYFIESIAPTTNQIYRVKFEGINTKEEAQNVSGSYVFVQKNSIKIKEPKTYSFLKGFLVNDKEAGNLGLIEEVFSLPMQELAQLHKDGKEILLPLNDSTILDIDRNKKTIKLDLPIGLLAVFLG